MKYRKGFVTNSSSSSFLIAKKYLDKDQLEAIRKHIAMAKLMKIEEGYYDYPWDIEENEDFITGWTYLDNFSMMNFLEKIEVPLVKVYWSEWPFDLNGNLDCYKEKEKEELLDEDWREILKELQNNDNN
jgi:hypothetical protein